MELEPRPGEETLRIEDIEAKIDDLGSELARRFQHQRATNGELLLPTSRSVW